MFHGTGLRVYSSTGQYVQGPGAFAYLPEILRQWPGRPLVLIDAGVRDMLAERFDWLGGDTAEIIAFSGEVTEAAVDRHCAALPAADYGVVAAIGGGKALDAGKLVALRLGLPVVTVPTIASTDAPASRGIALYDDHHRLVKVLQLPQNPAMVLVDTAIIAAAPPQFLRAGIGDALAKKFEGAAAGAAGALNKHRTDFLLTGQAVAMTCYQTLRRTGAAAVATAEAGTPNDALEATVEACFLMSAISFENTGLSLAHSLTRGLTQCPGVATALHGFHIAYGTLVQLAAEGRDEAELVDMAEFLRQTGLPTHLTDMGAQSPLETQIARIAALTMTSPHIGNLANKVDEAGVAAALWRVERLGL